MITVAETAGKRRRTIADVRSPLGVVTEQFGQAQNYERRLTGHNHSGNATHVVESRTYSLWHDNIAKPLLTRAFAFVKL